MYVRALNSVFKSIQKKHAGRLLYLPSKISIETGNICNLSCPLCPTNDKEQKGVKTGFLSFEDFKIIFDKIKPFAKTIDLFSWGEPFLNKNIGKMIKYAKEEKPSLRIFVDSNLNVLTDDQADAVVRYGLDVLKVSCDGVTQEVYQKYRIGGDINKVMANIDRL
ncbi:radical SAM protein, partial [Candidatus Omnitrophota bacterium]